ncbi:MAG TPA: heme A synthase [Anaerolineae bacterium]
MTLQPIDSRLRTVAYAASLFTFSLVVIGGIVRITGSGMGCPDWPLCYGQLIPPFEFHTLIEYVHRLVALLVALTIAGISLFVFLRYRHSKSLVTLTAAVIFLYLFQAVLGGITVLTGNTPWSVSMHLGNAMLLFGSILVIATVLTARRDREGETNQKARGDFPRMTLLNAAGVFVLILSGSYVVGSGASGACVAWPLCDSNLFPADLLQWVHMGHRLVAAVIGIYLVMTCLRARQESTMVERAGTWLLWLFIAQVVIGGANVLLGFPIVLNAMHLALATAVWGLAVVLASFAQIESGAGWLGARIR